MKPRDSVYQAYWEFAAKRQRMFFARLRGNPPPWSDDAILNEYKFCCSYRASDRVSQFLIREVIYRDCLWSVEDTVFRILLFKIFNKIETWQLLQEEFGEIRFNNFNYARCADILESHRATGLPVYSSAYMSCATKAFGFDQKHRNHLALIHQMNHVDRIARTISRAKSLKDVFSKLRQYPLIGDFMAYQLAIDLNYSEVINFSENDFTIVGPGSERGIRKCFEDVGNKTFAEIIHWMTENQEEEFARLGIHFENLWGRKLHAIDCQGLFCETDKYCRARYPELKSNRTRIKSRYVSNRVPIIYFYPPKWGINSQINSEMAAQGSQFRLVA
ncbi:MAG: hypothetical protein QOI07_3237 [Verrucomicrobiota bacterium]